MPTAIRTRQYTRPPSFPFGAQTGKKGRTASDEEFLFCNLSNCGILFIAVEKCDQNHVPILRVGGPEGRSPYFHTGFDLSSEHRHDILCSISRRGLLNAENRTRRIRTFARFEFCGQCWFYTSKYSREIQRLPALLIHQSVRKPLFYISRIPFDVHMPFLSLSRVESRRLHVRHVGGDWLSPGGHAGMRVGHFQSFTFEYCYQVLPSFFADLLALSLHLEISDPTKGRNVPVAWKPSPSR